MPYTDEGKAIMLYGLASSITHVSLHSGPPPNGHEIKGGVYRRKPIDFHDPLSGEVETHREVSLEVPEGAHVTHAGFWTALIGGTLLAWEETKEHRFRGRGVYMIDLATLSITES
jgi:hypothetical protein